MASEGASVDLSFLPEYDSYAAHNTAVLKFIAHLQAVPEPEDIENARSSVSLTAVLDKSGSMAGNKLDLVKRTTEFMMKNLSSKDKVGVVSYDSEVDELIKLTRTTEQFKREASTRIKTIAPGSCTNLSGGLFKGIEQQQANTFLDYETLWSTHPVPSPNEGQRAGDPALPSPTAPSLPSASAAGSMDVDEDSFEILSPIGGSAAAQSAQPAALHLPQVQKKATSYGALRTLFTGKEPKHAVELEVDSLRTVFLFTDGLANEGIQDTKALVGLLQRMLDKTPRVRVHTFGYGADHSPDMLQQIAAAGCGTYYYIKSEEDIPKAFADAIGGLLSVAAQNVSVEFTPAPGVRVESVHTAFKTQEGAGGAQNVTVGDVFYDESKDLLLDVVLPALSESTDDYTVGTIKLSYLDVHGACIRNEVLRCSVKRPAEVPADQQASMAVTMQHARVVTATTLLEAKKEADRGRYEVSRQMIQSSREQLNACLKKAQATKDKACADMAENFASDLNEALENIKDATTYKERGNKLMGCKAAMHWNQRAAALSDDEDECMGEDLFGCADDGLDQLAATADGLASSADGFAAAAAAAPAAPRSAPRHAGPAKAGKKFSYATKAQTEMRKKAKSFFG